MSMPTLHEAKVTVVSKLHKEYGVGVTPEHLVVVVNQRACLSPGGQECV